MSALGLWMVQKQTGFQMAKKSEPSHREEFLSLSLSNFVAVSALSAENRNIPSSVVWQNTEHQIATSVTSSV